MVNKLYAFCQRYQEKSPGCQIHKAQGALETHDREGLIISAAVDQKICEKCPDKKLLIERPECLKCGSWLIRECAVEAGAGLEFCYKCYPCNLYFYSATKLEQFARSQRPENLEMKPGMQAEEEQD